MFRVNSLNLSRLIIYPLSLKIVQITDPHLIAPSERLMELDVNQRLIDVLEHARSFEPDAYFLSGDCANEPVQEVYHRLRPLLDALGKPYYLAAGNHDDRQMMRNAFFLKGHGQEPIHGLIEVKNRHFLLLDTSPGTLDGEQVQWLSRALNQYPEADIVMHHPPIPMGVRFMDEKYPLRETDALLSVLSYDGRPRKVFCGHYHSARTVDYRNLQIHLCPPTSFYIDPDLSEFRLMDQMPGYLRLQWSEDGRFHATPSYLE